LIFYNFNLKNAGCLGCINGFDHWTFFSQKSIPSSI